MMFLFRFFLFLVVWFASGLYVSLKLYPLSSIAFWQGVMAASKTSLLDEILVNLLLILSGMFFSNAGGWLLWLCTYNNLLFGFMYGL